jgi:hypothetical protein
MKKIHERLITAAGIAVLLGIFCYQVCYGTNESSYKIGLSNGFSIGCQYTTPIDCAPWYPANNTVNDACHLGQHGGPQYVKEDTYYITNSTACEDGYAVGFAHWCVTDKANCIGEIKFWLSKIPDDG